MKSYYTLMARCIAALTLVAGLTAATAVEYPDTKRVDVVDEYHGTKVTDPYRWLESIESPETRRWVEQQNAIAQPWLESIPHRRWLKRRLTQLWNYERYGNPKKPVPLEAGGRFFFLRNDGTQNQSALYVARTLADEGKPLVDPNALRTDATDAIDDFEPNPGGDVVAYAISDGGTDWQIWKFRRVRDGVDLPDTLVHTKFWGISWARDGSGVYYSRYPARADGRGDDSGQPAVYFHRMGEPQEKDRLVYGVADHPTRVPRAKVTDDGQYLIVSLYDGAFRNGVDVLDLRRADAKPSVLFGAWDALYTFIGSRGDELYFHTTNDAPRGRVIAVDAKNPAPMEWRTVVPQAQVALDEAHYIGRRVIGVYVEDAHHVVKVFSSRGGVLHEVPLPGLGQVDGFDGDDSDRDTFFSYTDFLTPPLVYRYDAGNNGTKVWRKPKLPARTDLFATEQVFYASKDGTRVPMYVTARRNARRDGNQPVMLYGYGGFNASQLPTFSATTLAWLELGGTYAVANLRGGGEYGETWHAAGVRDKKQNVFDDFIAAAEHLVKEDYTRPERLAVYGRSNGGLLVAAVLTQRPELFGAALPAVGVLDMLRYHTASANARQWSTDYGLSENAADFRAQHAYSPVHNVKQGQCYPPTLITTADRDDRVVPWHSYKFAAALQRAQACDKPVLIRVETRAGHGAGKPTWMRIEDFADQWAFVAKALDVPSPVAH